MAKTKAVAKSKQAAPRQHSLVWLQGLACGAVVTLTPGFALLLGALLAPGVLALLLDREPGRPMARAVLLLGLATCVMPVETWWANGQTIRAALGVLSGIQVLGTAWSAAAAGWLLAELAPLVSRLVLDAMARSRTARLQAERAALVEAWGVEGTGDSHNAS